MLMLLAIFFPPLAVAFTGKPIQIFYNIILTFLGYIPGVIHAIIVVKQSHNQLIKL